LLILEAMKMENEIPAPKDGVVKKILVKEGDTVDTGQALIELG
ncbi:biotin/lipoyl-containing protein, partial [Thermococcus sp. ES12]